MKDKRLIRRELDDDCFFQQCPDMNEQLQHSLRRQLSKLNALPYLAAVWLLWWI
jgi:hypothetical protein